MATERQFKNYVYRDLNCFLLELIIKKMKGDKKKLLVELLDIWADLCKSSYKENTNRLSKEKCKKHSLPEDIMNILLGPDQYILETITDETKESLLKLYCNI